MILKHRDRELLRFDWVEPQGVRIVSVNEAERQFLPLEMRGALGARASSPRSDTPLTRRSSAADAAKLGRWRGEVSGGDSRQQLQAALAAGNFRQRQLPATSGSTSCQQPQAALAAVVTDESLWTWLRRRTVPKNRHYVDAMLGHLGIRQKDTRAIFSLALYRPNSRYDDFADLRKFIARVSPALYDDWLSFPGGVTDEMKQRLTHLKGFRFSRHKYYNLPAARLKVIEDFIQRRIAEIVDTPCRHCRSADGPSATSKAVEEGGGIPLPARIVAGQREADEPSALRQTKESLWHSRGYLPHVENKVLQFITYRLFDSVPSEVVDQWRTALGISECTDPNAPECQELRRRIEQYADAGHGSCLLADERVAAMVQENLLHFDGERYRLVDWCIMPNHVHVLIEVADNWTVSKIVQGWRSYTAHEANKILGRTGRFWQPEYFDRYIRNEKHLSDTIAYIDTNPDKAGLKEWKWRALYRSTAAPYTPTAASCQTTTPAAPCRSADGPSAASKAVDEGGGIPLPARTGNGQCEADEPSALRQTTPTLPSPARIVAGQREADEPSALRQEGGPQP